MKKLFLLLSVAILACSCSEKENEKPTDDKPEFLVLTFEDEDAATAGYWSSLISDDEGTIDNALSSWSDDGNTCLTAELAKVDYGYSGGGIAISNYYIDRTINVTYTNQLSLPFQDDNNMSGYAGSENFAVVYDGGNKTALSFKDGKARTIDHMYIAATAYFKDVAYHGNDSSAKMEYSDWCKVYVTGVNGTEETTLEYTIAENDEIIDDWNKWDLSSLGEVEKIIFTMDSSVKAPAWGNPDVLTSTIPSYIAIDNVTVVNK